MANTFITPTIVAREAILALENQLVFGGLVHRAYSTEYKKVGDTVLVRKPHEFSTVEDFASSGTTTSQTIVESSVAVKLDKHNDITFPVTSKELSLDVKSFTEQTIAPAMRAHAQAIDEAIAAKFVDIAAHYPVSTTPSVEDIAGIRTQLNLNKVPFGNRAVVMHPQTEQSYIVLDAFLHAEKRGDTKALKEASMGRVFGLDWYMDQNIQTHTSNLTDAVGVAEATAADNTALKISGLAVNGNSVTLAVGDAFKVDGETRDKGHVITTVASAASGGTVTAVFTPALQSSIASGDTVTFQKTHKANLALHKNAIALVTAPLEPPLGGARGEVVTYKGISCRVVYDYTSNIKTNVISVDILFGIKVLDKELACRLTDAR